MPKKITMSQKSYFAEHKNLVSLMRKQSNILKNEANKQEQEAKKMKRKLRY